MGNINWDSDSLHASTGSARGDLATLNFESGDSSGMDPEISGSLDEGNTEATAETEGASEDTENLDEGIDGLDETDDENGEELGGVDTELSADGDASGVGGPGGTGNKDQLSSALPSQQTASPASSGSPQMPQMPSMGSPSSGGSGGGMPSLPQMTQADLASAPNRNDLVNQLKADGPGEKSNFAGGLSDDEHDRKVQELAQKIVDMELPYTWGGGHGAEPGPSGGTRDGGVADQFGDYNKTGVDCSGLTRWMTAELFGVDPNGTSQSQYASGKPISASEARPGDMVFPASAGRPPQHVQVYVGNGQVIEAQKSGTNIMFSKLAAGGEFRRFGDY